MSASRTPITALLLLTLVLPSTGCRDDVKEAWKMGYEAKYKAAYQAGLESGKARGKEEGGKKGVARARQAAETGGAGQLYLTLACGALICGVIVGLVIQYSILLACRFSERMPFLPLLVFIPAMRESLSYSVFERRCELLLHLDHELDKLRATKSLHAAQIQAVHDAVNRRIMAARSVEELTQARLVELANKEFADIIAASEKANLRRTS